MGAGFVSDSISRLEFSPASEKVSFRSQAIGWLLITARYIKSSAVNNVITAVHGSVFLTGTGGHLSFFPLSLFPFTMTGAQFCSCYVIIPPQLLWGERVRGLIPQKQPPTHPHPHIHPHSPPSLPRSAQRCSTAGGKPQHHFHGSTETQNQQLYRRKMQGRK